VLQVRTNESRINQYVLRRVSKVRSSLLVLLVTNYSAQNTRNSFLGKGVPKMTHIIQHVEALHRKSTHWVAAAQACRSTIPFFRTGSEFIIWCLLNNPRGLNAYVKRLPQAPTQLGGKGKYIPLLSSQHFHAGQARIFLTTSSRTTKGRPQNGDYVTRNIPYRASCGRRKLKNGIFQEQSLSEMIPGLNVTRKPLPPGRRSGTTQRRHKYDRHLSAFGHN